MSAVTSVLSHPRETISRRRGTFWTVAAIVEVVLAAIAVTRDLFLPSIVILALAGVSLAIRKEGLRTLGFKSLANSKRSALEILGLTVGWTLVQIGVVMPLLNHLTGQKQDLSDFKDLQGNVGMLVALLAASWTLAALGEEIVFRGYIQTRIRDILGSQLAGVLVAVLLSSVLFSLIHTEQGSIGVIITFFDALFFSYLRLRYGDNLWAPVLAHGFNNTIGMLAFFLIGPVYGLW